MEFIVDLMMFAGGYTASIYSWAWLKAKFQSTEAQILALEAQATALKATLTITPK